MNGQAPSAGRLIIICGLSFAGKTTLADSICAEFGFPQVDVDVTMDDLFGPGVDDSELSHEQWVAIYRQTDARIAKHLRNGESVIDASRNFRKEERDGARHIAGSVGADTVVVYVDAPEWLVRQRWVEDRVTQARRDVSDDGFEEIIAVMEPPSDDERPIVFHHDAGIGTWVEANAGRLAGRQEPLGTAQR